MRNSVPRKKFLEKLPKNGIIAEIGVASGEHAISMMDISSPKKIFLIDPWLPSFNPNYEGKVMSEIANLGVSIISKNDFSDSIETEKIVALQESSVEASFLFKDEYFDYVYIDADHRYEYVKEDIEHWYPKIKVGGYITGHDYRENRLKRYGIKKAVDEFVKANNLKIAFRSSGHDWAVQKK